MVTENRVKEENEHIDLMMMKQSARELQASATDMLFASSSHRRHRLYMPLMSVAVIVFLLQSSRDVNERWQ